MKRVIFILLGFFAFSCSSIQDFQKNRVEQKLERLKRKNPSYFSADTIFEIKHDTILISIPKYQFDTILQSERDSIIFENERIKTMIQIQRDSAGQRNWIVRGEIKEILTPIIKTDTIFQIREKILIEPAKSKSSRRLLIAVLLLIFSILYLMAKIKN